MRAHDVAIGLAVAWARWRGDSLAVLEGPSMACGPHVFVHRRRGHALAIVDRGPVVDPVPLTDMRVAFGIAMAQHPVRVCWDAWDGVYIDVPRRQIVRRIALRPATWRPWCDGGEFSEDVYP